MSPGGGPDIRRERQIHCTILAELRGGKYQLENGEEVRWGVVWIGRL